MTLNKFVKILFLKQLTFKNEFLTITPQFKSSSLSYSVPQNEVRKKPTSLIPFPVTLQMRQSRLGAPPRA